MAEYKLSGTLREVGAELRDLREARGLTLRAVAQAAGISTHSRVGEAERGVRRLPDAEYARWVDALDLVAEDRDRILTKIQSADRPGHLAVGPPGIGNQLIALIDHEQVAKRITNASSLLVPGLLQTSDYARAILGDDNKTRVALRSGRRDILTRSRNPVEYCAIIDSEVLVRPIGAPDVMLDQMRHLMRMAELPNVTIQVVSSTRRGYNPMLAGPFELIEFEKAAPLVHLEHHRASVTVWDKDDVQAFIEAAEYLRNKVAMSPESSAKLIAKIVNAKETI